MNNKKYYQDTFSQLHSSQTIRWEDFERMKTTKRRPPRGALMLAATLAVLAALSATAFAMNLFGLRDVMIPDKQPVGKVDENGVVIPGETAMVDTVSLSGYTESPESKALAEWKDFLNGYDVEGAANAADERDRTQGPDPALAKYTEYSIYNAEMAAELDRILEKYGLALRGEVYILTDEEIAAQLGGEPLPSGSPYAGYMYDCGIFAFDGDFPRPDGQGVIDFQFRRSVKGYFDDVTLNIGDAANYDQWQYTTAGGETVLLALGPSKGLIFADFEDCFVSFNVLCGTQEGFLTQEGAITRADLEAMAEAISFSLLHPARPYEPALSLQPSAGLAPNPTGAVNAGVSLPEAFQSILLGEGTFFLTYAGEDDTLEEYCARRTPVWHNSDTVELYEMVPIDLDGDGVQEVVLKEQWQEDLYHGFLILRAEEDGVHGYSIDGCRSFMDLKVDGTFGYSSGAGDFGLATMDFGGRDWQSKSYAYQETVLNEETDTYSMVSTIRGVPVDETAFSDLLEGWNNTPSAMSYSFAPQWREQNVKALYGEN